MSIGVTADTPDPRNHAASAWLRGFRWALLISNKINGPYFAASRMSRLVRFEGPPSQPLSIQERFRL
jgi:hypothetical protein